MCGLIACTGVAKKCFPGLVNFVIAVAFHFCLNLPATFSQPGKHSFGTPVESRNILTCIKL